MQVEKTVFISYRRTNAMTARAVYQDLRAHGYDCFLDFQSIDSGAFAAIILRQIAARAHFVLILTPSALQRCVEPGDWLRREIEEAMRLKRNIVPLMFEDFDFRAVEQYLVGDYLPLLQQYSGIRFPVDFFEEAMGRLRTRFLNKPLDLIVHPTPAADQAKVQEQQAAIAAQPTVTSEELSAEEVTEKGNQAYHAGNYEQALQHFNEAIRLNPQYADAYNNRALIYHDSGKLEAALPDYDEAIRLNPQFSYAYNNRGVLHQVRGDLEAALRDFDAAIQYNPQFGIALHSRGSAYLRQGKIAQSLADFNAAIQLDPADAYPYVDRAYAYYQKGDLRAALDDYQRYLDLGGAQDEAQRAEIERIISDLREQLRSGGGES